MQEQEAEIDGIVTRFTGKVYKGVRWVDVTETDIYSLSSTEIDYETEMRLCELDAEIAAHFLSGDADKQAACERELDCILGGIENGKQFCDLTCDQCAYRYEASSNLLNGLKFHIGDLVVKLAKRLLVSFVAQSLIDLIESLVE